MGRSIGTKGSRHPHFRRKKGDRCHTIGEATFNLGHISAVLDDEESLNTDILAVLKRIGVIAIILGQPPKTKTADVLITDEVYSLEAVIEALSLSPEEISAQITAFDPKI